MGLDQAARRLVSAKSEFRSPKSDGRPKAEIHKETRRGVSRRAAIGIGAAGVAGIAGAA